MIEQTVEAQEVKKQTVQSVSGLDVIHPTAAGLDLHKEVIVACAPMAAGDTRHPVRKFGTYTSDLRELTRWLKPIFDSYGVIIIGILQIIKEITGFDFLKIKMCWHYFSGKVF